LTVTSNSTDINTPYIFSYCLDKSKNEKVAEGITPTFPYFSEDVCGKTFTQFSELMRATIARDEVVNVINSVTSLVAKETWALYNYLVLYDTTSINNSQWSKGWLCSIIVGVGCFPRADLNALLSFMYFSYSVVFSTFYCITEVCCQS